MKKEEQQYKTEKEALNIPETEPEIVHDAGPRTKEFNDNTPNKGSFITNQEGRVGYIVAWMLGVPAWVLLMVFLIRGH